MSHRRPYRSLHKANNGKSYILIMNAARWIVRICFLVVFAWNVQCAVSFIINPAAFIGAFQLSGMEGEVALRGLGIAFLMWNATYPLFIWKPDGYPALGVIVLVQQLIGAIGETVIFLTLPTDAYALHTSIARFMTFDIAGLVIMGASFFMFIAAKRKVRRMQVVEDA